MLRKQAAIDLESSTKEPSSVFITEQDIDNHLIWCDRNDNGITETKPPLEQISETVPAREQRLRTIHTDRDWDFFYAHLADPARKSHHCSTPYSILPSQEYHPTSAQSKLHPSLNAFASRSIASANSAW